MLSQDQSPPSHQPNTNVIVLRDLRLVEYLFSHSHTVHALTIVFRSHILADPTSFEEPLLDTSISVIVDEHNELISVSQLGLGSTQSQDALLECIAAAKKRSEALQYIYRS